MRIITGHQPTYLPWLGLFHKIVLADAFVFMDDVQYLENDWNNRNRIKDSHGPFWLTVPVHRKASASLILKDIRIADEGFGTRRHWQAKHWQAMRNCYGQSPYWSLHAAFFEQLYTRRAWAWLSEINETILRYCLDVLEIRIEFVKASEAHFEGRKSDLVLDHCRQLGAQMCVLGRHGRDYLNVLSFFAAGVFVHFQDYQHPRYPQRFGEFAPQLSIVDLLFNCGPASREILLSGNVTRQQLIESTRDVGSPCVIERATAEEVGR